MLNAQRNKLLGIQQQEQQQQREMESADATPALTVAADKSIYAIGFGSFFFACLPPSIHWERCFMGRLGTGSNGPSNT